MKFSLNEFGDITDEELAVLAKTDKTALDAVILRFSKLIRMKAVKLSFNSSDADDLYQEGIIGLLNAVESFETEKSVKFSTFAGVCIVNRMRTYITGTIMKNTDVQSFEDFSDDNFSIEDTPESIFINRESFSELIYAVNNILTETERMVFLLNVRGYSYKQIASELKISEKSVDNAVQRARNKVRKYSKEKS